MSPLKPAVRKALPVAPASWRVYHALSLTNPKAARAYYVANEKQLSPVFRIRTHK